MNVLHLETPHADVYAAHASAEAERVYLALAEHVRTCPWGCWPHRDAPWQRDALCEKGAALVDDYATAVLQALEGDQLAARAAVPVRLGHPGQPRPPRVLEGETDG